MALNAAEDILNLSLSPDHKHFMSVLSRKQAVISAVLSATTRITPGKLRGETNDKMTEILERMKAERAKIAGLTEGNAIGQSTRPR